MTTRSDVAAAAPLADGRYLLLEILGEGGMATVYRAFDARLQVSRAVKVLSPNLANRKALRERFEAEARTMAQFDHPNIVRVIDVGIDGERVYIVMELVSGGSLLERVRDHGPLPPRMALDVMIEVLRAMQAAHEHGVVHRDIKPHNVLLTEKGQIRVTDFGIARLVAGDDDDELTRTGAVMGTWGFMAPEQKENAKAVDFRADLYSAGATLWAIITNQTPGHLFAADLDPTMMEGIPEGLAFFIKRATRYRREDRYADAAEMIADALALREQLPAPPPETPALATPPRPRNLAAPPPSTSAAQDGTPNRNSATMVPDATPVPGGEPESLTGSGSTASGGWTGRTWERSSSDALEVDLEEPPPRRVGIWTWLVLGLLAVMAAGAMALALPRLLMPAPTLGTQGAPIPPTVASRAPAAEVPPAASAPEAPAPAPSASHSATGSTARTTSEPRATASRSAGPSLSHSAISSARSGDNVTFKVRISGSKDYTNVLLNYRARGTTVWSNRPMYAQGESYTATVQVTDALASGFEYFILARPDSSELPVLSSGSYKSPHTVAVK